MTGKETIIGTGLESGRVKTVKKTASELNAELEQSQDAEVKKRVREAKKIVTDAETQMKKILTKKSKEEPQEPLQKVPKKYTKIADVEYCRNQKAREEIYIILDALQQKGCTLRFMPGTDTVVRQGKRLLCTFNVLRHGWSYMNRDGLTFKTTKDNFLNLVDTMLKKQ